MRSRSCARSGCQLAALTSASKPAASSPHMVVNIASLPSTVMLVTGLAAGSFRGAAGLERACAMVVAGSMAAESQTAIKLFRKILLMPFVVLPEPLFQSYAPAGELNAFTIAASCQHTRRTRDESRKGSML